jgi:hypothetical protein
MGNVISKTAKSLVARTPKPAKGKNIISEEDIRRRAFEIYQGNGGGSHNELDDWFRAERELRESEKQEVKINL